MTVTRAYYDIFENNRYIIFKYNMIQLNNVVCQ